jgi:hypothetical protein
MWGTPGGGACQYGVCPDGYKIDYGDPAGWNPSRKSGNSAHGFQNGPTGSYYPDTCPCKLTEEGKARLEEKAGFKCYKAAPFMSGGGPPAPCVSTIGEGFCRDENGEKVSGWSFESACVDSLEDCLQDSSLVGADTACIAYAESPDGDSDGCGDMGKSRCAVYTGIRRLPQPAQGSGSSGYTTYAVNDCPPVEKCEQPAAAAEKAAEVEICGEDSERTSHVPVPSSGGRFTYVPPGESVGLWTIQLGGVINPPETNLAESKYGRISCWDTSKVTDFASAFSKANAFNQPLYWDTSSVTNMGMTFNGAAAFDQPLVWDTSQVTTMHGMFGETEAFDQELVWDTSAVTTFYATFLNAKALNSEPAWDTSKVTTWFYRCRGCACPYRCPYVLRPGEKG